MNKFMGRIEFNNAEEADLQKRKDIIDMILYYTNGTDDINNIKKIARAAQDVFYSERPWFKDFIEDDLCR